MPLQDPGSFSKTITVTTAHGSSGNGTISMLHMQENSHDVGSVRTFAFAAEDIVCDEGFEFSG